MVDVERLALAAGERTQDVAAAETPVVATLARRGGGRPGGRRDAGHGAPRVTMARVPGRSSGARDRSAAMRDAAWPLRLARGRAGSSDELEGVAQARTLVRLERRAHRERHEQHQAFAPGRTQELVGHPALAGHAQHGLHAVARVVGSVRSGAPRHARVVPPSPVDIPRRPPTARGPGAPLRRSPVSTAGCRRVDVRCGGCSSCRTRRSRSRRRRHRHRCAVA